MSFKSLIQPPIVGPAQDHRTNIGNGWGIFGVCLLIAVSVGIVFWQTIYYGFVDFDDDVYVFNNPVVSAGLTLKGMVWAFTHVESSNWHPLTWISHMLDCQLYGLNPGGHHLTNVSLHMVTAVLLFLVLRQMTGALWRSAFVAMVFAVHPLHAESVAWIAERKDVLSGLFFMLTIGAYVRYARLPWSGMRYTLVLALFGLGLMCKPMLVTLPFLLLLLDFWPLNRWQSRGAGQPTFRLAGREIPKRLILEKIPFLGLAFASCAVTLFAQQEAIASLPLSLRVDNALVSYIVYLAEMLYPARLAVFYPHPVDGLASWKIILSLVLLVAITGGAVAASRNRPWLLTGWFWYLGMLIPVIGILQVGAQAHADRYTYLPQIGLYILLTWMVADLCAAWRHGRKLIGVLASAVLVALIMCARIQASYWKDSESLWTHALACAPDNLTARINLGNALLQQGKVDAAMKNFQIALQLAPESAEASYNLGNALLLKGEPEAAAICFEKALEIRPNYVEAHINLGNACFQQGNVNEAISHFRRALELKTGDAKVYYDLGNALSKNGETDKAIICFQQALHLNPDDAEALNNLGIALLQKDKVDEAIKRFQQALQFKPNDAQSCYNLGIALLHKGSTNEAMARFQRALDLKPDYSEACYNLGMAFLQKGDLEKAMNHLHRVLQIKPDDAQACYNLGNIYVQKGALDQAVLYFQRALQIDSNYSDAQNNLAWLWATAPSPSMRNGQKALVLAQQANRDAGGKDPDILDTLAAACAEAGQFDDARKNAKNAIQLAQAAGNRDQVDQLSGELKLYEAGFPYHQETK
jgi:tetratricopeptide (TPR) repeat protein